MMLRNRLDSCLPVFSLLFAALAGSQVQGATLVEIGFDDMVSRSEVIVRATVVDKAYFEKTMGTGQAASGTLSDKVGVDPASPPSAAVFDEPGAAETQATGDASEPPRPIGLGTEGGRMIFTEITLVVDETLKGHTDSTITLRYPGGTIGDRGVVIHGLPEFEPGQIYILFLRPGYAETGDPVVGVNQGFFSVLTDNATGREILLNANGEYVVGIEQDRIVTRIDSHRSGASPGAAAPPPVPEEGYDNVAHGPGSVSRYSSETPLSPADLKKWVRDALARSPEEVQ